MTKILNSGACRGILLSGMAALPSMVQAAEPGKKPMNVLFIVVDDLKPMLGCYGNTQIKTPNIDRLARWGTVFTNAYCQQAVSAPTRVSLLTGFRPDNTRVHDLNTPLPTVRPDLLTLPGLFRKNGYTTISLGKVFHHGRADAPDAWSVDPWMPPAGQWVNPANMRGTNDLTEEAAGSRPWAFERYDADDGAYRDGQVASKALSYLSSLSKSGQPFFLAAGFIKPHLPFVCPEKYWRLYDNETINLPAYQAKPEGGPDIAMTNWGELRRYKGIPAVGPLPADTSRLLMQGYMACVSFTDAQVGKLLDEVERLGLKDNTVIVLFGDHGWHLGDHGLWCKHTNFEQATRAPLIIYVPGIKGGKSESAMVEFVDVYPSIAEVCGLSPEKQTEGRSLVQLMKNPGMNWNEVAFSQYPRGRIMGYSARTQRFRYTAWIDKQGRITQSEFYDYLTDPLETKNNVRNPEYQPEVENLKSLVTSYASGRYIKDKGATGPQ